MILKVRVFKNKMNTVPPSFIRNHKYYSKGMREGHPNPVLDLLRVIFRKVRFVENLKYNGNPKGDEVQVDRKHDNNLFQASLRPK